MFTVLPLLCPAALAQAPPAEQDPLIARIEARYAEIQRIRMRFTQTVRSPLYGDQEQGGTVAFARPGKMHWTFEGEGKHYIGTGEVMWVYLEQEHQAFKYAGWNGKGTPESLLGSLDSLDELFTVTVARSDAEGHRLTLRPRADAAYDHVELSLGPDLVVRAVVVQDGAGTTTTLTFTGVELDPELSADTFRFTPPPGVEVIEAALPE